MSHTSADSACSLTSDALHLAISLDSFTTLDLAGRIGPAVQRGKQQVAEFRRRRVVLILTRADSAIIGWLLETIDDRLSFLERLNTAMCRCCPEEQKQRGLMSSISRDQPDASSCDREGTSAEVEFQFENGHAA